MPQLVHECLDLDFPDLIKEALASISPGDADMTADEMDRSTRAAQLVTDHVLIALVEGGLYDVARAYVERTATERRTCDARYGSPREIPFGRSEWESLIAKVGRVGSHGEVRTGAVAP